MIPLRSAAATLIQLTLILVELVWEPSTLLGAELGTNDTNRVLLFCFSMVHFYTLIHYCLANVIFNVSVQGRLLYESVYLGLIDERSHKKVSFMGLSLFITSTSIMKTIPGYILQIVL